MGVVKQFAQMQIVTGREKNSTFFSLNLLQAYIASNIPISSLYVKW